MAALGNALVKVAACVSHSRKKKRGKGMLPLKKVAEDDPLEQFMALARGGELAGTGLGAGAGALLGALLGKRVGAAGDMFFPVAGAAGTGLLGKYLGRKGGEQLGLHQLEQSTGTPWELP